MQQQPAIARDPTFYEAFYEAFYGAISRTFFRFDEKHVVKVQSHARRLPLPARAAVVRRDDCPPGPDGPAVFSVDEMYGAQSLRDFGRFFVPGHPAVNGSEQFSASAHHPGMFGV